MTVCCSSEEANASVDEEQLRLFSDILICTEALARKAKTLISVENRDYHDTDV